MEVNAKRQSPITTRADENIERCNYEKEEEQDLLNNADWVILESSDGCRYKIKTDTVLRSGTITDTLEETGSEHVIPLKDTPGKILECIIDFLNHYDGRPIPEDNDIEQEENFASKRKDPPMDEWDKEFLQKENATLFALIDRSNYFHIDEMLQLCCWKVASLIKGKTPEEIRKQFGIEDDFDENEKAEIQKEMDWINGKL